MKIIGIDPGLATIGFAILEVNGEQKQLLEYGVIRTSKDSPKPQRLKEIHEDISSIISMHKPNLCSIEQLFFSKNITTGIQVAEARGILLLALFEHNLEIHEFTPSAMKKALTGNGQADKQMVQKMVKMELNLDEIPKPDDAADAVSLALALAAELRYYQLEKTSLTHT